MNRVTLLRSAGYFALAGLFTVLASGLSGCKSAYIDAEVRNQTGATVPVVEVDYPSASFGRSAMAAGASFHYRFKIIGSGPTKALWTDAQAHEHTITGPSLHEGQTGSLVVVLEPGSGHIEAHVTP